MADFPRIILPIASSPFEFPSGMIDPGQSGKIQVRGFQHHGRTWSEVYPLLQVEDQIAKEFLAKVNQLWSEMQSFDIQHPAYETNPGFGGGSPLVVGAGQTGSSLNVDAVPIMQLVSEPANLLHADWSVRSGTPVVTGGIADPLGASNGFSIADDDVVNSEGIQTPIVTPTGGDKFVTFWWKPDTVGGAGTIQLVDDTAAISRLMMHITDVGGGPSFNLINGQLVSSVADVGGWYRVIAKAVGLVAINVNRFVLRYNSLNAAAVGTVRFFGPNVWESTPPSFDYQAQGGTVGWLKAGAVIRIAGRNYLYDVTGDANGNKAGAATIPLHPKLYAPGPADNAAVTVTNVKAKAMLINPPTLPTSEDARERVTLVSGMTLSFRETG